MAVVGQRGRVEEEPLGAAEPIAHVEPGKIGAGLELLVEEEAAAPVDVGDEVMVSISASTRLSMAFRPGIESRIARVRPLCAFR
jgi:hypothetical protein